MSKYTLVVMDGEKEVLRESGDAFMVGLDKGDATMVAAGGMSGSLKTLAFDIFAKAVRVVGGEGKEKEVEG